MTDANHEDDYYAAMIEGADLASHDELAAAIRAYGRAVAHAQELDAGTGVRSAEALLHLATCQADQGAHDDALAGLDRAIALLEPLSDADPGLLGRARVSRAAVRAALDRYAEAAADTRAAIDLLQRAGGESRPLLESAQHLLVDLEAEAAKE